MELGKVTNERWRTIAVDVDGVPQPDQTGKITLNCRVYLAWKDEADTQKNDWEQEGFTVIIGSAAVSYFGPSDAPGNCWAVIGLKEVSE